MANSQTPVEKLQDRGVVRRWAGNSQNWLNSFLRSLSSRPNIVSAVAMGSAVRAHGHRRSDFDLLVLYRGERPAFDAPLEVDIRAYPVEGIEEKLANGHEIIAWAVRFGVAIYDKEQLWQILQSSWAERVPLPSAPNASERGRSSLLKAQQMLDAGDESAADDLVLAALTQFARAKLIDRGVFPASRPELPTQLRSISQIDPLAQLLEDAMYDDRDVSDMIHELKELTH